MIYALFIVLLTLKLKKKMFELIKNNQKLESIDSLFNNFFNDTFYHYNNGVNNVDYYCSDDDKNYYIDLALPGLEKKDINLNISDNYLLLNYKSKDEKDNASWKQSFRRSIKLPKDIKTDGIDAKLKNGILSIKIQKDKQESKNQKIEIK